MMNSSRSSKVAKQALRRSAKVADGKMTTNGRKSVLGQQQQRMSSTLRMPKGSLQAVKRLQNLAQTRRYTTEEVLKLRGATVDKTKTLYNAADETENCGVGLIANMKSIPSRHVVEVADEMLVRMAHRGGCGCDPNSGDGAGE